MSGSDWWAPTKAGERQEARARERELRTFEALRVKERIYSEGKIWKPSKIENTTLFCTFVYLLFFYNTQYNTILFKKIKRHTQNCVIWRTDQTSERHASNISVRFGRGSVSGSLIRWMHCTGIWSPFKLRSWASALSVNGSDDVGQSAPVGWIGDGISAHTPNCHGILAFTYWNNFHSKKDI